MKKIIILAVTVLFTISFTYADNGNIGRYYQYFGRVNGDIPATRGWNSVEFSISGQTVATTVDCSVNGSVKIEDGDNIYQGVKKVGLSIKQGEILNIEAISELVGNSQYGFNALYMVALADWNGDGNFETTGNEFIGRTPDDDNYDFGAGGDANRNRTRSFQVTVPATAKAGTVRIRMILGWMATPNSYTGYSIVSQKNARVFDFEIFIKNENSYEQEFGKATGSDKNHGWHWTAFYPVYSLDNNAEKVKHFYGNRVFWKEFIYPNDDIYIKAEPYSKTKAVYSQGQDVEIYLYGENGIYEQFKKLYFFIYADWNGDGEFDGEGENLGIFPNNPNMTDPEWGQDHLKVERKIRFKVPKNAKPGVTRIRIMLGNPGTSGSAYTSKTITNRANARVIDFDVRIEPYYSNFGTNTVTNTAGWGSALFYKELNDVSRKNEILLSVKKRSDRVNSTNTGDTSMNEGDIPIYQGVKPTNFSVASNETFNIGLRTSRNTDNINNWSEYWGGNNKFLSNHFFAIYIDWNGDGKFNEDGDEYINPGNESLLHNNSGATGTNERVFNIKVPKDAKPGNTRARVIFGQLIDEVGKNYTSTTVENKENARVFDFDFVIKEPKIKLWLGTNSTDYSTASNWKGGVMPTASDIIEFATVGNNLTSTQNDLHAPTAQLADSRIKGMECSGVINRSLKSLVIPVDAMASIYGAVVVVDHDKVKNPQRIVVEADANSKNGTLHITPKIKDYPDPLNNENQIPIYATVEMYGRGNDEHQYDWVDNIPNSPTNGQEFGGEFSWQYFGIPIKEIKAEPTLNQGYVKEYSEPKNRDKNGELKYFNKWITLTNSSILKAFKGYAISQKEEKVYRFEGELNNIEDVEFPMTRQAEMVVGNDENSRYGLGECLFANSLTESMLPEQFEFPDGVEKTIYMYNTGSFVEWYGNETSQTARVAGSYIAFPRNATNVIETADNDMNKNTIPSMQGFMVRYLPANRVYNPNVVDILKYKIESEIEVGHANTKPQAVPRKKEPTISIDLNSKSTIDKLILISKEGTQNGFDNGWDGYKFFGTPTAFIYTETEDGNMQINTSNDINGKIITFYANNDTDYSLTLTKGNSIDEEYPNLNLLDLEEGIIVPLISDTTIYKFKSKTKNSASRRFKIVDAANITEDMMQKESELYIKYYDNKIVARNLTNKNGFIQVVDISGRTIMRRKLLIGKKRFDISLERGAYIINVIADGKKESIKVLI